MFDAAPGLKRTFAWDRAWAVRFESLWSLTNKFAVLNVVSAADVCDAIGSGRCRPGTPARVRRFDRLTDDEVGVFLGLPAARVAEGRPELLFAKKDRPWLFPRDTLRYCPECIAAGYHSSLHQPHCVKICPIHGSPIESACPSCRGPLSLFPAGQGRAEPYACSSCGHKLWRPYLIGAHGSYRNVLSLDESHLTELVTLHDWFVNACSAIICRTDVPRWLEISGTHVGSDGGDLDAVLTRQAPQLWGSALGVKVPRALGGAPIRSNRVGRVRFVSQRKNDTAAQPAGDEALAPKDDPDPSSWDSYISHRQTFQIYKSVRRHLRRAFLQQHRVCADMIESAMWREPDGTERHPVCPWALAYLFWRRLWEKRLHFSTPRTALRLERAVGQVIGPQELPTDLLRWVNSRALAQELTHSFEECVLLARAMRIQGRYSWDQHQFKARRYPYWVVTYGECGEYCWSDWASNIRPSQHLGAVSSWRAHRREAQAQVMALRCDA